MWLEISVISYLTYRRNTYHSQKCNPTVLRFFSSLLWLIISIEDALHQPTRLLILAVGTDCHDNDWGYSETMFTSWQQHPALSVCSSKHFHLAHFWSSCLISLWRQKSFKPHSILGQHIYWGLAFQYLREINTAPWFMNPCHPPTGLVRGPSYSTLLLPLHTMGFRYQKETHKHTLPYIQLNWVLRGVYTANMHRSSLQISLKKREHRTGKSKTTLSHYCSQVEITQN